jgi:arsenite oxidase small subunit
MSDLSRRNFFKLGAGVVGGACAASALTQVGQPSEAEARSTLATTLPYPRTRLANLKELSVGKDLPLTYPDKFSPISLLKLGRRAVNGVGAGQDIVNPRPGPTIVRSTTPCSTRQKADSSSSARRQIICRSSNWK